MKSIFSTIMASLLRRSLGSRVCRSFGIEAFRCLGFAVDGFRSFRSGGGWVVRNPDVEAKIRQKVS